MRVLGVFLLACGLMAGVHAHAGHHHELIEEVLQHTETVARVGRARAARELKSGMGGRHSCGNDHPALKPLTQREPETISVKYGNEEAETAVSGRRLQRTAVSTEDALPIRIKMLYNQLDGQVSAAVPEMCASASDTANVLSASGGREPWQCTNDAVPTGERNDLIRQRLEWAVSRFEAAIRVNRVAVGNPIVIPSALQAEFYIPAADATVQDADLVVIVVAWPSPFIPAAGWAACRAYDQNGRCVVGYINIVPELVDVEGKNSPSTIVDERHTALHELVHVLGGIIPTANHLNATGYPLQDGEVFTYAPALPMSATSAATDPKRVATYIRTPRVLQLARAHFNCSTLPGVPLEDLPLGRGSHWEARVMGPELMSYGTASGETYVSDLTVAMLEDTHHYYVPDYEKMTGTLYDETTAGLDSLTELGFSTSDVVPDYVPPAPRTRGALRWGINGGCGFVLGDPKTEWDERHICLKHSELGCTPDNRMAALCTVRTGASVAKQYSCGLRDADGGCAAGPSATGCDSNDANCALPVEQQHFTAETLADVWSVSSAPRGASEADLAIDRVGGFSGSMDFVPVRFGYWSCLYSAPGGNSSSRAATESGGSVDNGDEVGDATSEQTSRGGQTLCRDCRCFQSTLNELSRGVAVGQQATGMCFASNCYRSDYLQIAVRSGGVAYWYRCPPDGGKIFVPGFTGRVTCPPAKAFCAGETVTGRKFPESGFVFETVLYAGLGIALIITTLLCLCPPVRRGWIKCARRRCAVEKYEPLAYDDVDDTSYAPKTRPSDRMGRCVLISNTLTMTWGLFLVGFSAILVANGTIMTATLPLLGLGGIITILTALGSCGVRVDAFGPSCASLIFIYASFLLLCAVMIYATTLALDDASLQLLVGKLFDLVLDALPASVVDRTLSHDEQVLQATAYVRESIVPLAAVLIAAVLIVFATTVVTACTIRAATLAAVTFHFVTFTLHALSVVLVGVGSFLIFNATRTGTSTQEAIAAPGGAALAVGLVIFVSASISVCAGHNPQKRKLLMFFSLLLAAALFGGSIAAAFFAIANRGNINSILGSLTERQLAVLQEFLGGGLTQAELALALESQLLNGGIACIAVLVMSLAYFVSGVILLRTPIPPPTATKPVTTTSVVPVGTGGTTPRRGLQPV